MNLPEALSREIARCSSLLDDYAAIGTPGLFGHACIADAIEKGHKAASSGEATEMLEAFQRLEGCQ